MSTPKLYVYSQDTTSGRPCVEEKDTEMVQTPIGHSLGWLMVQPNMKPSVPEVVQGMGAKPGMGQLQSGGLLWVRFQVPERTNTNFFHFSDSLTYTIVIKGELHVEFHDGTYQLIRQGDVFVNTGCIHSWNNVSDEPCELVGAATACQPTLVNGKPLDEAPFNAQNMSKH